MSGKFRVTCPSPEGNDNATKPYTTEDLPLSFDGYWVAEYIQRNCTDTYYKLDMWEASTFDY